MTDALSGGEMKCPDRIAESATDSIGLTRASRRAFCRDACACLLQPEYCEKNKDAMMDTKNDVEMATPGSREDAIQNFVVEDLRKSRRSFYDIAIFGGRVEFDRHLRAGRGAEHLGIHKLVRPGPVAAGWVDSLPRADGARAHRFPLERRARRSASREYERSAAALHMAHHRVTASLALRGSTSKEIN